MKRNPCASNRRLSCLGGPLDGRRIWIATRSTLTVTIAGQTGRYVFNKGVLIWTPLQ